MFSFRSIKFSTTSGSSITESRQPLARTISDTENKENKVIPTAPEKEDESGKKPQQQQPAEPLRKKNIFLANDSLKPEETRPTSAPAKRPASKMFGRISKFKHLKGDVILKGRFENLKNLSRTVPAECDFFHANADRVAVPLTGPGGKIAVFETRRPGRIPDGVTPVLINATSVMDFGFDPFDNSRLVAACDDGRVRLWKIPDGGLVQQMNEPEAAFSAHADKIQIVKFHPLAKDVLLTAAFDRTVKIWDLSGDCAEPMIELEGHEEQLYSAQFSQCGRFLATVCKDGKIRIYEPRKSSSPVLEGAEIVPKKGARIVWAMDGKYLIVTGFSRQSERQVMVYRSDDLNLLNTVTLDVSPAIIIPHYDADSNTLFLTGKVYNHQQFPPIIVELLIRYVYHLGREHCDDVRGLAGRPAPVRPVALPASGPAPGLLLLAKERLQREGGRVRPLLPPHQHHHRAHLVHRAQSEDRLLPGRPLPPDKGAVGADSGGQGVVCGQRKVSNIRWRRTLRGCCITFTCLRSFNVQPNQPTDHPPIQIPPPPTDPPPA